MLCRNHTHRSSWMRCSFYAAQDCTSSKVTKIEENLSSGSPLPDQAEDHFQPIGVRTGCVGRPWRCTARRRDGRERKVQQNLHMLHSLDISLGNPINTHSPDLETDAKPLLSYTTCMIHTLVPRRATAGRTAWAGRLSLPPASGATSRPVLYCGPCGHVPSLL